MKNKGLIITLIIILTIIMFFLIMFLVTYLRGGISFRNGGISLISTSKNIIYDKTYDINQIRDIEIKQNAGDIIFKETSNNNIQVVIYGDNERDVSVNIVNNNLNIDYSNYHKFLFFSFGTRKNNIIVYVPSNYSNKIDIKNDYGNCQIANFENATINIDCDAGNVETGKIKNAIIKCDYGNIEVGEILNKCELKADCGNIEVRKMSIRENSTIRADLGNISVNEANDIFIEADVDLGKTNITHNNRNSNITLKIKCDCGNINVG